LGVDIVDPPSVRSMAKSATDAFGGVDILVNNAALMAELGYLPAVARSGNRPRPNFAESPSKSGFAALTVHRVCRECRRKRGRSFRPRLR
jgi:NAD(P)-dependent dehydrogenase (short-subunit alcohol dehydrogenase family)